MSEKRQHNLAIIHSCREDGRVGNLREHRTNPHPEGSLHAYAWRTGFNLDDRRTDLEVLIDYDLNNHYGVTMASHEQETPQDRR